MRLIIALASLLMSAFIILMVFWNAWKLYIQT